MQTNSDMIAQAMRCQVAAKQPKAHIPIGIGGFFLISAMSPIAALPWAWALLVWWHAEKQLAKNGKAIKDSYGQTQLKDGTVVSNAYLLEARLGKGDKQLVQKIAEVYPPEAPFGQKKPQPLLQKTQPRTEEGVTSDQPKDNSGTSKTESGSILPEPIAMADPTCWQPQPLPAEFVTYLASQVHLLVAATTGSGKTWFLRCLGTYLSNQGHVLVIADPKGTVWGDLTPAVLRMRSGSDYRSLLNDLHSELETRIGRLQKGEPVGPHLWAILDEWILFKGKAHGLDPKGKAALEQRLLDLIAAGRELNMHLVMVNQSHILGDLSLSGSKNTFSSGLRDNLCTMGLGCKITQDSEGNPMRGNSKSIDNMLRDQYLVSDAADRTSAAGYHAELRRSPETNRTYCVYASELFIGETPDLTIPALTRIQPFLVQKQEDPWDAA
jgi:hypothetical protein